MPASEGQRALVGLGLLAAAYCISLLVSDSQPSAASGSLFAGGGGAQPSASSGAEMTLLEREISERRRKVAELQQDRVRLRQEQASILQQVSGRHMDTAVSVPVATRLRAAQTGTVAQAPPPALPVRQTRAFQASGEGGVADGSMVQFQSTARGCFLALDGNAWLTCDDPQLTPLSDRAFQIVAVGGEWVALKPVARQGFMELVPKNQPLAWVVREVPGNNLKSNPRLHWRMDGNRLFNRHSKAFVNVISATAGAVRGHGNKPRNQSPAGMEATTVFKTIPVSSADLSKDQQAVKMRVQSEMSLEEDYIRQIHAFPKSSEKRVISYGLYGSNPKYVQGGIRNAELVKVYFPGWVARFYMDNTVPAKAVAELQAKGAEIIRVEDIKGGIAGMFWRFLVADDPSVDRYIVRDSDSRLNARERFAVEEWIRSGKGVHTIRDHPNHDRPLNGGLWGGVHGAVKGMSKMVRSFSNKGRYGGDLHFLNDLVWPQIKNNQLGHDAYSCQKYPNSIPFPTKRPDNYQHVGQVFDATDKARRGDIDGYMRGREIPMTCRKQPSWKYG
eukprot:CAMPEP_0118983654 /NCGR_PEP_ID=MMETSP1173-20130426/35979_1 /TAXON_ID=1034831 /ORGANISM="Rhizochromulina marina cf, Strain CCMP1243" /LENGTH=557 /DNA_ID=CAMNT_0006934251 /DNA_START=89 /DNA_END=1762 /DNA_ORIENTATION=-